MVKREVCVDKTVLMCFYFLSSSDEPLKWQFVDQFVSESGVRNRFLYFFMAFFHFRWIHLFTFLFYRRKKAASQAWHPLEAKKSKRRRFFSALWRPRVWALASLVVQPRNLVSISVMSSQAPCLQKLASRWLFKMTRSLLWISHTHISACCELHLCLIPKCRLETRLWRWTGWISPMWTTKRWISLLKTLSFLLPDIQFLDFLSFFHIKKQSLQYVHLTFLSVINTHSSHNKSYISCISLRFIH